jgi:small subunit ribosomal protein S4
MGDPKRLRKAYSKPRKAFQKDRIIKEREVKETYGLKNKKEFYRAESIIRSKRATARKLLALDLETRLKREKELLDSLKKLGILQGEPTLEDVLELTPEALLERRLQTIVWRKGLANTTKQARQFITHGHIAINKNKINIPSYVVTIDDEKNLSYFGKEMQIEQTKHEMAKKEEKSKNLKEEFEEIKEENTETNKKEITKTEDKKEEKVTING